MELPACRYGNAPAPNSAQPPSAGRNAAAPQPPHLLTSSRWATAASGAPPLRVSDELRRQEAAVAPRKRLIRIAWVLIAVTLWACTIALRAFTNIDAWDFGWVLWLLSQDFLAGCVGVLLYILFCCKDDQ